MILESIELKNIRSYEQEQIKFPKGITLFEGDMGSGKSTILMAIEFALFGTGSQKGDTLLSKKAKEGTVVLNFQVDGTSYEVKRDLKRTTKAVNQNPKNCHLKIGNEVHPFSPGDLKREILKILKFNEPVAVNAQSKIYRYAIFTPQTEIRQILYDSDKRLETIRRAFGVEDYKKAKDNAERINRSINTRLEVIRDRIRNDENPEDNLESWKRNSERLKKSKEKNKQTIKELEVIRDRINDQKNDIEKQNSEKNKAVNKKETIEAKLESKNSQKRNDTERISEIKNEQQENQDEIDRIEKTKSPSELTLKEIDTIINQIEKLSVNKIEYGAKKKRIEEDISKSQKLGMECTYCHQKITKEHQAKMKDEGKAEIVNIESKLIRIDDEIQKLLVNVEIVKKEESSVITRKLMELKNDLIIFEESKEKRIQLQKRQEELNKKLNEKQKLRNELERKITDLKNEFNEITSTIESLPNLDKDLENIQKEEEKSQKKISIVIKESGQIQSEISNAERQIELWKVKVAEVEDWKIQQKKIVEYHTWIKQFFIPTVDQIEKQVLISIQQDFNKTYRKWYNILIDDTSKDSRLDEDFTPILEQDGYEQDFNNLSGGEQTSISLAYRLSLNTMMRKTTESLKSNLLILDEPTDGFSKNQLAKVKNVLRELDSEQIILVSHEKELETYVDNVFQISKSEGYSKIK
tara:strand:+ start:505 stop:2586 length:2082 start_codon:yes stop_codon:yes gene_type:complete